MKQSKLISSIISNWIPKIFSFVIAVFIVVSIRFFNVTDRVVTLPLEVALPEDFAPASLVPETIDIAITGSDSIIYLVNPDEIKAYADFSDIDSAGIARTPIVLEYNEDVFVSDGISVTARPSSVRILFEESL